MFTFFVTIYHIILGHNDWICKIKWLVKYQTSNYQPELSCSKILITVITSSAWQYNVQVLLVACVSLATNSQSRVPVIWIKSIVESISEYEMNSCMISRHNYWKYSEFAIWTILQYNSFEQAFPLYRLHEGLLFLFSSISLIAAWSAHSDMKLLLYFNEFNLKNRYYILYSRSTNWMIEVNNQHICEAIYIYVFIYYMK